MKVQNNFEKVYEYFFGDYPDLIEQIKNGSLTGDNISDIVSEYNTYKESINKKKIATNLILISIFHIFALLFYFFKGNYYGKWKK